MFYNQTNELRSRASKLIELLPLEKRIPVAVEDLPGLLGINVDYSDSLPDEISGFFKRNGKGNTPVIVINSAHPKERGRFTLAHEIGHYLLHAQKAVTINTLHFRKRDSSLSLDLEEIEANQFAAELLMPYHLMISEITGSDLLNHDSVNKLTTKLSKKFLVSEQAMTFRIAKLFF
ncbi:MAG: ImmA/IrrE family metallo-endopeptidase [Patescibacteria group bacterium]|nr:MAG: ImmA/IrrE family metallo-endopeptidase [Patescibacteria group bacterium]